jgi:hypothetical protein
VLYQPVANINGGFAGALPDGRAFKQASDGTDSFPRVKRHVDANKISPRCDVWDQAIPAVGRDVSTVSTQLEKLIMM